MFYLDDDINPGNAASIVAVPTPNSSELIEASVTEEPITPEHYGAHLVLVNDAATLDRELTSRILRRIASKFGAIEGIVTELADIGFEDSHLAGALIVESDSLNKIYNQTVNAFTDGEIEFDPAESISLHLPVTKAPSAEGINKDIIGRTIKFDHFALITKDDSVTFRFEDSDDDVDAFYITQRRDDCDGYALVKTKDNVMVSCHADKTSAEQAMKVKEEEAAAERSSSLIKLDTGVTFSSERIDLEEAEEIVPENQVDTFNIVHAEDMGSTPLEGRASAEQMKRLLTSHHDLEGPSLVTGRESGDGRILHPIAFKTPEGTLNTRQLPLPYMFGDERAEHHQKARLGGWTVAVEAVPIDDEGNYALFSKTKLLENELGQHIYDAFSRGEYRGVSADIDSVGMVGIKNGSKNGRDLAVLIQGRFMGSTAVPFPALEEAGYWLAGDQRVLPGEDEQALVASGDEGFLYEPQIQVITLLDEFKEIGNNEDV